MNSLGASPCQLTLPGLIPVGKKVRREKKREGKKGKDGEREIERDRYINRLIDR